MLRRLRGSAKWSLTALAFLALALWVTSLCADVEWAGCDPQRSLHLARGCLIVGVEHVTTRSTITLLEPEGWTIFLGTPHPIIWWFDAYDPRHYTTVYVPMWLVVLLTLMASASLWRFDARAGRRLVAECCRKCGYDRRGLAPDAKCPECGTVPIK